jgi:uncharacterized coiled-coil DUF342 family protein
MFALLAGIISKYAVWFIAGSLVVSTAALVQTTPKSTTRVIKEIVTEENIVQNDSLKTRLSEVEAKVKKFTEEETELIKKTGKARKALDDVREKADQFIAENEASIEGQDENSEAVLNCYKEIRKHNEKIVNAVKDYVQNFLKLLDCSINGINASVEECHLKGYSKKTIKLFKTTAFELRKTADEIKKKFKVFKDLTVAEIYYTKLNEFREFLSYIDGNFVSDQKS